MALIDTHGVIVGISLVAKEINKEENNSDSKAIRSSFSLCQMGSVVVPPGKFIETTRYSSASNNSCVLILKLVADMYVYSLFHNAVPDQNLLFFLNGTLYFFYIFKNLLNFPSV